jgi:hypothetical protein
MGGLLEYAAGMAGHSVAPDRRDLDWIEQTGAISTPTETLSDTPQIYMGQMRAARQRRRALPPS